MQDLLSNLDPTIAAILIVAGVLALVIVVILTRRLRRRQGPLDSPLSAAPGLGGPVDYTSLPLDEEPSGWRERFARLSIAGKILVILVPILAILGVLVLVLALSQEDKNLAPIATPTPTEPVTLNVRKADVIRTNPITIGVAAETTGIADGTEVTVELLADGKPLAFLDPESTTGQIRRGEIEIEVRKLAAAAAAVEGVKYNIRVSTTDGQASSELALTVPPTNASAFYDTVTNTPTPTVTVEVTATQVITTTPEITVTVTPSATPVSDLPSGAEVTVRNGGNVRALPIITPNNRVGGINANDKVQLIERTPNGLWYHIRFTNTDDKQEKLGWVSTSLLNIPATVQTTIPVATIVSVFVNGPLYEKPDTTSTELDRVNINEVVNLKHKTASGDWYEIENVRGISGWVQAKLLGIPEDVAAKVPVAP